MSDMAEVAKEQQSDPVLSDIHRYIRSGRKEISANLDVNARKEFIRKCKPYLIDTVDDCLYTLRPSFVGGRAPMLPLVVPPKFQPGLIQLFHDSPFGGHLC
jgi:hypothetical protein